MTRKAKVANAQAEVDFYTRQIAAYAALAELLTKAASATGGKKTPRKTRLSMTQYRILSSGLATRNMDELRSISELPAGAERATRSAAFLEWEAFSDDLLQKDPRRHDTSDDAEADRDENEDAEETTEDADALRDGTA